MAYKLLGREQNIKRTREYRARVNNHRQIRTEERKQTRLLQGPSLKFEKPTHKWVLTKCVILVYVL